MSDEEEDLYASDPDEYSDQEKEEIEDEGDSELIVYSDEEITRTIKSKRLNIQIVKSIERCSSDMATMFELTQIVGMRAELIQKNGDPLIDPIALGLTDPIDIAKEELLRGLLPFTVRRVISVRDTLVLVEEFDVRDLIIPPEFMATR